MSTMIKTEKLSFTYPAEDGGQQETSALREVDLEIKKGSFVTILGHNGSGKSTLAKHMNAVLLPTGGKAQTSGDGGETLWETFSLEETEKRMAEVLGAIDGVGRVRIMLTLRAGSTLRLAEDSSLSDSSSGQTKQEKQVLTVNRGSGRQEVVVTQQLYPTYQGAVVVCEGAGSSSVRLAVVNAVSVLTGLSSDRISVVKWKS